MKKFFTLLTVALAFTASASAKYQLSLEDLPNGWGSTYDAATKTITYEEQAWGGRGWNMSPDNVPFNFIDEDVQYLVVKLKSSDVKLNLVAEYTDGTFTATESGDALTNVGNSSKAYEAGETLLVLPLDDTYDKLIQIYIQNQQWLSTVGTDGGNPAGTAVIEDAFLASEEEYQAVLNEQPVVAEEVIWSGNTKFDSWTGFSIGASKFAKAAVGDKIVFTLTELFDVPAQGWDYGAQVLVKKSTWGDFEPGFVSDHIAITEAVPYTLEMTIREDVLEEAQANGLVIQGMGFTVTEVKILYAGAVESSEGYEDLVLNEIGGATANGDGTISITDDSDWGWHNKWYGEFDASAYDYFVIELAEPATFTIQGVVEYAGGVEASNAQAEAGELLCKVPLNSEGKAAVTQAAYQNGAAGTVKIKRVFWATQAYLDSYTTGINAVKTTNVAEGVIFNLAGQRVNASYKGVVIQNGRKYILK